MATSREIVEQRARRRCEYCLAPQSVAGYAFHLEHIQPRSRGGADKSSNYALACVNCNSAKSDHLTGEDLTTGKLERLFNPRTDKWPEHFQFSRVILKITGQTGIGRATESRLRLNSPRQIEARAMWVALGIYP